MMNVAFFPHVLISTRLICFHQDCVQWMSCQNHSVNNISVHLSLAPLPSHGSVCVCIEERRGNPHQAPVILRGGYTYYTVETNEEFRTVCFPLASLFLTTEALNVCGANASTWGGNKMW